MPPTIKYDKEDIVNAACEIVKEEGFEGINARKIAKRLGCSIQPIFYNFETMEKLNEALYSRILDKYREYTMSNLTEYKAYKSMGISYIRFAREYPMFFKALFMQETDLNVEKFMMADDVISESVMQTGMDFSGLSYEEQQRFHVKVWIFTHGIACLAATKTIDISDEEIDDLLGNTVAEMLQGYISRREDR